MVEIYSEDTDITGGDGEGSTGGGPLVGDGGGSTPTPLHNGFCCGPGTNYFCYDGFEVSLPCPVGLTPCAVPGTMCGSPSPPPTPSPDTRAAPEPTPTPSPSTEGITLVTTLPLVIVSCATPSDPSNCIISEFSQVANYTAAQYCALAGLVVCQIAPTPTPTPTPSVATRALMALPNSQTIYSDQTATISLGYSDGSSLGGIGTWSVRNINPNGYLSAAGQTANSISFRTVAAAEGKTITVTLGDNLTGQTASANITVVVKPPNPVFSLTVDPKSASVDVGSGITLTATPKDSSGNVLTNRIITWSSSNSSAASVNGNGQVVGINSNLTPLSQVTITATCEGKSGSALITVTVPPPPLTPQVSQTPQPSLTPQPSRVPLPTPTPSMAMWRSCVDGVNHSGTPTAGYIQVPYLGAGGGMCWEPQTRIGFTPSLDSVYFSYQKHSTAFPNPQTFAAQNSSYSLSFNVKLTTNNTYFAITPSEFTIPPRESRNFTVAINNQKINEFAEGQTRFDLSVETTQI